MFVVIVALPNPPGNVTVEIAVVVVPGVQVLPPVQVSVVGVRGKVTGGTGGRMGGSVKVTLAVPLWRVQQLGPTPQVACLAIKVEAETVPAMSAAKTMLKNLNCI